MKTEQKTSQLDLFNLVEENTCEELDMGKYIANSTKRKPSAVVIDLQLRRTQARDREFIRSVKAEVRGYDFA